jgi:vacuolar-type H+-ATPase subunit H
MNWAKYADKKGKTADFKSKERVVQKAISEVKDDEGKVVRQAVEEKKEALADTERQWSLPDLEREKARYDADCARAKSYSDGLALAIEDFKKL